MSVRVELRLEAGPRATYAMLVAALVLLSCGELGSETLTLSTYYPSPLGVYKQLIATGANGANTLLARDGGRVGIGTSSPAQLLSVAGAAELAMLRVVSTTTLSGANSAVFQNSALGPNASYVHWGATGDWRLRSANSAGTVSLQDSGGNVGIGTSAPVYRLDVSGRGRFTDYLRIADPGCSLSGFSGGGWDMCPGNTYATWTPGLWQDGYTYQRWPNAPTVDSLYAFQLFSRNTNGYDMTWRTWSFDLSSGSMYCCPR